MGLMEALRTPDSAFEGLPGFDFTPHYAEVGDGLRVHYLDEGPASGPVVLLMHGEPSWCFLYRHMIPVLVRAGLRCIAPDLIGFGRSDKPVSRSDYTYAHHVEWMRAMVVDHLGLGGATLVGQDWGGLIGLRLVAEHPDRFARVVVANTGLPTGDDRMSDAFFAWQKFSQETEVFPVGAIINGGCTTDLDASVVAGYDAPFPDESYKAGARAFPLLVPTSPDDPASEDNRQAWKVFEGWEKPFLTAFSDSDPITRGGYGLFQRTVPGAKGRSHATIEGGGHFLQEDRGPELATVVAEFIANTYMQVRLAFAPGRVNLIGDHTDYTGGLVLPMALEMGTTVSGSRGGSDLRLESDAEGLDAYAEAVAGLVAASTGFVGRVMSDLPIGAGLSSSASLEVALALALGCSQRGLELARLCQEAEHMASGVPCGIMDQLASVAGVAGHALLIDCSDLSVLPVPVPPAEEVEIIVVHSGEERRLAAGSAGSGYADRRRSCEMAAAEVGPLRTASLSDVESLDDAVLRTRARHVVTENERVRWFASSLAAGDLEACGRLMGESHRSLAVDFEVSTPGLDALVGELSARPGVFGARLTGAGFGGCVVALARPGALDLEGWSGRRGRRGWRVRPGAGAFVTVE